MSALYGIVAGGGRQLALLLALVFLPAAVSAQTGRIAGTVTGADRQPVSGAQVFVDGTGHGALSDDQGAYVIDRVPAGVHTVRVTHLGFRTASMTGVRVTAGETTRLDINVQSAPIELGGVVVSASRQAERITDAPATITRIDGADLELSVGNSFSGALKQVKGIDYIQVGATTAAINARGFNSSFNNRMLMMEDGRISVLPESGLPLGLFTAIPKIDLASVEVLVGPGAALYGADASNGVISIETKDPFEYQGTTVEVSGGSRDYRDVQFRHATAFDTWAFKVTGEYQQVSDWENRLRYGTLDEIGVDFDADVARVSGALVRYFGDDRLELSGGWSQSNGVGQTNVGRNQFVDWTYNFAQAQFNTGSWYFNLYRNQSQSGESYAINRYTQNRAAMPSTVSDREVQLASDWPSDGQLYAAEVQNHFGLDPLRTDVVWGAQYRRDIVSSDREWLTDRLTAEDIEIDQYGVYAQTRTELLPYLDLVLAARLDGHDNYDTQLSPKAGLLVDVSPEQTLRLTYNRAFKSPTILQTNFWIPDFVPFVGVFGNTRGFEVVDGTGAVAATYSPIEPEENETWELGFKGLLGESVFLDVALFRAEYTNFFSPLTIIANPFAGTSARFTGESTPITGETGNPQILLTYFNLGSATLNGMDMGLDVQLSPRVTLEGTLSWLDLDDHEAPPTAVGEEATALNSPDIKWTVGLDFRGLEAPFGGTFLGDVTLRHVDGYDFRSGINAGLIPSFTTLDATLAYRIADTGAQVTLGMQNLLTCHSVNPDDTGSKCGFDERHIEMVNMPAIGSMFFLGVRYHR